MKSEKKQILCFLLGLTALFLTGCSKLTAEELLENIENAAEENFISGRKLDVSFDAAYDTQFSGIELSMDIKTSMHAKEIICKDTFESYSKSDVTAEFLDQNYEYSNEIYRIEEDDGNLTTYTYDGLSDEWSKEEAGMSPNEYYEAIYSEMAHLELEFDNAVLNEEKTVFEDKDAYIITAECSGMDMFDLLDHSGFLSEMDYSISIEMIKEMKIPIICWFDAENYLPLEIEAEEEAFAEFIEILLTAELEAQSGKETQQSVNVRAKDCSFIMKDFSYETQTMPEFPESARNSFSIIKMLEHLSGTFPDGTLVLRSGSKAARFDDSVLEDYMYHEARVEQSVTLKSTDETKLVRYEAMSESMARQYFKDTEGALKNLLREYDIEAQADWRVETVDTHLGKVDVYCMNAQDGLTVFHTVIVTDHISICISVFDFVGEWYDPEPVIEKYTTAISEITAETLPFMSNTFKSDYEGSQMIEMMDHAVGNQHVSSAEVYFSEWGIYIAKDEGAKVQSTNAAELSGHILISDFLEYNDRVPIGLYNGKEMYSMTVRYSGKAFLEVLKFCSPVLLETDASVWAGMLENKNLIGYLIIDSETKLPAAIMFDISEINTLLQTDRKYLVVDKIKYEHRTTQKEG